MNDQPVPSGALLPSASIDDSIYVMPAFATLTVRDLDAARRWYTDGLGFIVLAELPGPDGSLGLIHLRRFRFQDILLTRAWTLRPGAGEAGQGAARPGEGLLSFAAAPPVAPGGLRLSFAAGDEDLERRAAFARAVAAELGAGEIDGPTATPWNTVDLTARDPDGFVLVLTALARRPAEQPAFTPERLRQAAESARVAREG